MFKQILNNQRGMSLIEVIVASTISIIVAMGVVKINETSQQGFNTIKTSAEIQSSKDRVQGMLMSGSKCAGTSGSGNSLAELDMSTATNNDGIFPPFDADYQNYLTTNTLTIVTGPGADGLYGPPVDGAAGNEADNTTLVIDSTVNAPNSIPGSPNWEVNDPIRVYPYTAQGATAGENRCIVMIPAVKSASASRSSMGGDAKTLWYDLSCNIASNAIQSCSSNDTVAEGIFQDDDTDGTWSTNNHLYVGPAPELSSDSFLTVAGDVDWINDVSLDQAIQLPTGDAIIFGDNQEAGIGYDGGSIATKFYSVPDLKISSGANITLTQNGGIASQIGLSTTEILLRTAGGNRLSFTEPGALPTIFLGNGQTGVRIQDDAIDEVGFFESTAGSSVKLRQTGDFVVDAKNLIGFNSAAYTSFVSQDTMLLQSSGQMDLSTTDPLSPLTLATAGGPIEVSGGVLHPRSGLRADGDDGTGTALEVNGGSRMFISGGSSVWMDGGGNFTLTGGGPMSLQGGSHLEVTDGTPGNTSTVTEVTVRSPTFSFVGGGVLDNASAGTISANMQFYAPELSAPNHYATNYLYYSDERYKKEIETIKDATEKLSELRGVTYFLRKDEFPDKHFEDERQIGLIAQEVELIFPELVRTAESGYKSVMYGKLVAVLLEGFKDNLAEIKKNREMIKVMQEGIAKKDREQDARLDALEAENKTLRGEMKELKDELKALHQKLDKLLMRK